MPLLFKRFVLGIKVERTEFLNKTDEAVDVASEYISEMIVGKI